MRKQKEVQITTGSASTNRDYGKLFLLTELPAVQAEKWAMRALLLAVKSGAVIPDNLQGAGFAGIAIMGIQTIMSGVAWKEVEPLLDEMFTCIQVIPDPHNKSIVRPIVVEDIEEIGTRIHLRKEVFELHLGFSLGGGLSDLTGTSEKTSDIPRPPTSPGPSPSPASPVKHLFGSSRRISR